MTIGVEQKTFFDQHGYVVFEGVFSPQETADLRDHYMRLREQTPETSDASLPNVNPNDPLKRYPRMLQMHRWDDVSLSWMLDDRINQRLTALMGREPFAVQTMIYFKPPGARGQALHQDQYYLRVQPGTCVAAWMALDRCDEANGCLQVVPGSHKWPLLCTVPADTTQSFTDVTVPIPEGQEVLPLIMNPGDVLFFNGTLVHGSGPNTTTDRFRRALIGHYIDGDAQQVAHWYHPVLRMDGSLVELNQSQDGGACGVWVDQAGQPVIEVSGFEDLAGRTE